MPETLFNRIFKPKGKGKWWWAFTAIMVLTLAAGIYDFGNVYNKAVSALGLSLPKMQESNFRLGLDLQGGSQLTYKADVSAIPAADRGTAVDGARDVIERRVNSFGVSEPLVQVEHAASGDYRIIVELAGIKDIKQAIQKIGETPLLQFKEQNINKRDLTASEKKQMDDFNNQAKNKAQDTLNKVLKGDNFGTLAKAVSQDVNTKDKAGDLGWVTSVNQAELINGTLGLKNGQIAPKLITTSQGLEIVKLNDKRVKKDSNGQPSVEIKASHLLICWTGISGCESGLNKQDVLAKINKLKTQANKDNFKDLVKANSTDPSAKVNFGDLGWFAKGTMVKSFDEAIFATKANGVIIGPVETEFGYHLIYKEAERQIEEYNLSHVLVKTKTIDDIIGPQDEWVATKLTGRNLKRASVQFNQSGLPEVSLEFDADGGKLFADITGRNVGKPVGIFLDGYPISTPNVNEAITGGQAVISGKFNTKEANDLVKRLNAGALPVPIELVNQQTVGSTLGQQAVDNSLVAGLVGLLLVALFMIIYYRLPGLLSVASLLIYGILVLAVFKWNVTLTLPGIAGFIMTIGVAVDANILIFERMKEELRSGKSLSRSIEEGFSRAWPSIRDGNFNTIIVCVVLMIFSSSIIKGFAVTLFLGVLVSLFTAIVVTRTFLKLLNEKTLEKHSWLIAKIKK